MGRRRTTVTWLLSAGLLWLGLMVLARLDAVQAVVTSRFLLACGLGGSYLLFWGWRMRVGDDPRNTLLRSIMVTITLVAIVGVLELVAAAGMVRWGTVLRSARGSRTPYMTSFIKDSVGWFQRPPGAHWTDRPRSDLEARWGLPASLAQPITFTFDARGFRNLELLDTADVLLIGDSYVEGAYVSDDQTLGHVLQTSLARPVANLGVAGFGPSYELHALTRHAEELDPEVVIWFFFEGNDLYDPDFVPERAARPPGPPPARPPLVRRILTHFGSPSALRQRSFTYNALWGLSLLTHPLLPNRIPDFGTLTLAALEGERVYFGDYGGVPWTSYEVERWGEVREFLRTGATFARGEGIHLLAVFIPTKFRVYRPFVAFPDGSPLRDWGLSPLPELFVDFCLEAGLACLDLTEPLQEAARAGRTPYALVDTHWGPDGHEAVARLLAAELERRGWLGPAVTTP